MDQLKALARMIDIIDCGHAVTTSLGHATGSAGPHITFGCDAGGAFVRITATADRLSLDDAKILAADLFNAIYHAAHQEWARDRGIG